MEQFILPGLPILNLANQHCFAQQVYLAIATLVDSKDESFFFVAGEGTDEALVVRSIGECPVDSCIFLVRPEPECNSLADMVARHLINLDALGAALRFQDWDPRSMKCQYLFETRDEAVDFVQHLQQNDEHVPIARECGSV